MGCSGTTLVQPNVLYDCCFYKLDAALDDVASEMDSVLKQSAMAFATKPTFDSFSPAIEIRELSAI